MNRGITKENMLFILPPALRDDASTVALAETTAEVLANRPVEIDRVRVISNIDGLNEAVLDILARDFKVDWYDPDYSLEEKRRTVKSSWRVHKTLGTKAAVETAIRALYPLTTVEEWFEYGGEPFHFRVNINITDDTVGPEKQRRVLERMNFYKPLRAHNDGVNYVISPAAFSELFGDFYFCRLLMALSFDNQRVPVVRFDGGRSFDGEILFAQGGGILFPVFTVQNSFVEPFKTEVIAFDGGRSFDGGILFNQAAVSLALAKGTFGAYRYAHDLAGLMQMQMQHLGIRVPFQHKRSALAAETLSMKLGVRTAHQIGGSVTIDNMRTFDGSIPFDGRRPFNASITKEEI